VFVLVAEEAAFNFAVVCCTQVQQFLTNVRLHGPCRLPAVRHGTDLCIELTLASCCSSDVTVMILAVLYVLLFAFCRQHVYKLQFDAFISLPVACFIVKESLCLDLSPLDSNFCANAATYLPFLLGFAK